MLLAVAGLDPMAITERTRRLASGDWSLFSPAERSAFVFARKQAKSPSSITKEDWQDLVQHFGLERALDVLWWSCRCHYMTRVADAFQLPLERENVFAAPPAPAKVAEADVKATYLRPTKDGFAHECDVSVETDAGKHIQSYTDRGNAKMRVKSRFDKDDMLVAAEVSLTTGDSRKEVFVTSKDGKAQVKRTGHAAQEFDVPKGVIVTSAPDWTDTFLLCLRYDLKKAGKQEFPGLWVHPVQQAQLVTFTIERLGENTIDHDGKKLTLHRFHIHLRNNSPYVAWATTEGRMVKLVPLPYKKETPGGLVLTSFEKASAGLEP